MNDTRGLATPPGLSPRKRAVAGYFDSVAPRYDPVNRLLIRLLSGGRLSARGSAAWVADRLALVPGMRALDLACGTGQLTIAMARRVGPTGIVIGVDFSSQMLVLAQQRLQLGGMSHVLFRRWDAEQLEAFGDGSFEAIGCQGALHFFEHPGELLHEVARLLASGGRIGFLVPLPEGLLAIEPVRRWLERKLRMRVPAREEVDRWLREAGLTEVSRLKSGSLLLLVAQRP